MSGLGKGGGESENQMGRGMKNGLREGIWKESFRSEGC